jgi:hypothetical protein
LTTYCIYRADETDDEAYWVGASSERGAFERVGLALINAGKLSEAKAIARPAFDCVQDGKKSPPPGVVFTRNRGNLKIVTHK